MEISINEVKSPTEEVSHNTGLNSSEIGNLWSSYMAFSMLSCVAKSFYQNADDKDIKSIIEFVLEVENSRISKIIEIFHKENMPIPIGFSDEDLDLKALRLYSDIYYLYYFKFMERFILPLHCRQLVTSTRSDVREFYFFMYSFIHEAFRKNK